MIVLHALKYSRATRVLWLLADLGQACSRIDYDRTEAFGAPDELGRVHPLGKSPVIQDGREKIAESATILRYLVDKFEDRSHSPPRDTTTFWQHEALFDYVEASFADVVMQAIRPKFQGKDVPHDAMATLDTHLSYIARSFQGGPLLFGDHPTLADIQMSYPMALLARFDLLKGHPKIEAYWQALQAQPGYEAAVEAAGPMAPPENS